MGETIIITSAKDGVGKTVIASNIAVILANWGYQVLLIDMNIGRRNLDMRLGMEDGVVYDLADVIMGTCRIRQGIIPDRNVENLSFMMPPQSQEKANINPQAFKALCRELEAVFDYIIIDSPASNCPNFQLAISPSKKSILLMISEYGAIRDAELVKLKLKEAGIENMVLLVNKEYPELVAEGLTPHNKEISEFLSLPVVGTIEYNKEIHRWANKGQPVVGKENPASEKTPLHKNLEEIAHRIISEVDYFASDTDI